jgi:hypothetical protein
MKLFIGLLLFATLSAHAETLYDCSIQESETTSNHGSRSFGQFILTEKGELKKDIDDQLSKLTRKEKRQQKKDIKRMKKYGIDPKRLTSDLRILKIDVENNHFIFNHKVDDKVVKQSKQEIGAEQINFESEFSRSGFSQKISLECTMLQVSNKHINDKSRVLEVDKGLPESDYLPTLIGPAGQKANQK